MGGTQPTAPRHPGDEDSFGNRRKLIVFTEHRDTLRYLVDKIKGLMATTMPS